MTDFIFFKKGKQITALEKSDADSAAQLATQGLHNAGRPYMA